MESSEIDKKLDTFILVLEDKTFNRSILLNSNNIFEKQLNEFKSHELNKNQQLKIKYISSLLLSLKPLQDKIETPNEKVLTRNVKKYSIKDIATFILIAAIAIIFILMMFGTAIEESSQNSGSDPSTEKQEFFDNQ